MLSIPLPFVTALLLSILLARLRQAGPIGRSALLFVGACTALAIFVGLRWTFDIQGIRFVLPIVASLLPASAWLSFEQLVDDRKHRRKWAHVAPIAVVAILSATWTSWHPPIDLVLAISFFAYGFALLRLGISGVDGFGAARLADADRTRNAAIVAGVVLVLTGLVDLLLAGDFDFYRGTHSALIVAVANMLSLPLIAYAVAVVGEGGAIEATDDSADEALRSASQPTSQASGNDDARIVETVDRLLREQRLFRDPDLTLNRLSRRARIPSRQISAAVNRVFGKNVSQVVNDYRIEEAKDLLQHTDAPITKVMYDVGFQTKSNFNREFLRVTGITPRLFRQHAILRPQPER